MQLSPLSPRLSLACTRGCATRDAATNPFRLAIPRARGTTRPRVIAFISRTMKPICDVVYTPLPLSGPHIFRAFLSPAVSLPLHFTVLLALSLSYLLSRQETAFLASTACLCLSLFAARCIGMRILSRAASALGRFDLRGCAHVRKIKVSFCFPRV